MGAISADILRAAGQLRACLGPLVRRLRQIHAHGELTRSQIAVLARLERDGPAAPAALAAAEQIRPQSVAATLTVLEQHALVNRRPDPDDGRKVIVAITKAGRSWVQEARQERAQRLAQAIADEFSPAEQRQLIAAVPLLERLSQII